MCFLDFMTWLYFGPYPAPEVACMEFLMLNIMALNYSGFIVIQENRDVGAHYIYICFCLKLNAFFTLEILLQYPKGCTDFCNAMCVCIIQGCLAAGIEGLCAGIHMALSQFPHL